MVKQLFRNASEVFGLFAWTFAALALVSAVVRMAALLMEILSWSGR